MNFKISKYAYILSILFLSYWSLSFYPRWEKHGSESLISWDVSGYYWYLPSIFIYKDLKHQSFKDSILKKYEPTPANDFQQGSILHNGNYVMKYSSGMAIMYLPFFTIAHLLAKHFGYPADGFSAPYQLAIQLGGLLFSLIGLYYFRKLLLKFYSDIVTTICLLILAFGTNYLNYAAIDTGMSHCWLFTIYVFILLSTIKFYQKPSFKFALIIGLLCGLATLTRPTDIISCLIPLLWGLESISKEAIRNKLAFLKTNLKYILVTTISAALVFSIQLFYWKYVSGNWLVYSYNNQGFTWLHPHIKGYLFSTHNGWLAYAPVLAFAFIGFLPFLKNGKNKVAIVSFIILNLYIVVSWEFYYCGGRFMIQSYPLLFFPLASFMEWMLLKKMKTLIFAPIILLCVYIGMWTNIQYHYGGLYDFDTSPRKYYLSVIGRWHVPEKIFKLKDTDELFEGTLKSLKLIYQNDFEQDSNANNNQPPIFGKHSFCLDNNHKKFEINLNNNFEKAQWLRAASNFHCVMKEWNVWNMAQFIVTFSQNGKEVKSKMIRVHRFLDDGNTKEIFIDVKIPKESFDKIRIAIDRMNSDKTLVFDDLRIYTFNE